jgi:hypothetical protein
VGRSKNVRADVCGVNSRFVGKSDMWRIVLTSAISPLSLTRPAVARVFSYTSEHTSWLAQEMRLFLKCLFICVTLRCSACCVHRFGVAHQSSLRSPTTTMSFSISLFREAGSLINQPVTFAP